MKNLFCFKIQCGDKFNIQKLKQTGDILENNNVLLFCVGNIFNTKQKMLTLKDIYQLYHEFRKNITNYLDGTYSLIIIDKKKMKLYVFQDLFGSNQNIYFYKNEKDIVISNELKQIILQEKNHWILNEKSVKRFLKKGFITNKDTLVRFISKVPGKRYLEINLNNAKCRIKKYRYKKNIYKINNVNRNTYCKTIEEICSKNIYENMGVTISSGYDTNFLIYNLRKHVNEKLNAFCIGGVVGRNEIPDAYFICEYYNNINFYSKLVDGTSLMNFPEIVFALEGAIYESGIFLQYELAKLIKEHKIENMILGECADQVLHYNLHHPFNSYIDKILYYIKNSLQICQGITIKPYKDIYEMASYKVLKKNGILMNYYEINTQYPYLRRKFMEISKKIVIKGDNYKKYHKETIHEILPSEIVQVLKKIGGATELKTLFIGEISLKEIKKIARNSKFYKEKKFNDEFYEIDYFMKIIYLEIFEKMFIKGNKKILDEKFNNYDLLYFFPELSKKKEKKNGKSNFFNNE